MTAETIEYVDPLTGLRFQYPTRTPDGQGVVVDQEPLGAARRYHVMSEDRAAIYFELRSYDGPRTPVTDWEQLRTHLVATYDGLVHAPLATTRVNGLSLPAWGTHFSWPEKSRALIYLVVGERLARIIYNPESALNEAILGTLSGDVG